MIIRKEREMESRGERESNSDVRANKFESTNRRHQANENNGGSEQEWPDVVYISDTIFEETKKEALQFRRLMEKEVVTALEDNNFNILRYAVNRLHRIRRSVSQRNLKGMIDGDSQALERALKELLLCSWSGPIVKFIDKEKQDRIDRGETAHLRFLRNNQSWLDSNTRIMLEENDGEGIRMATNQVHYKSLRNLKDIEDTPQKIKELLTFRAYKWGLASEWLTTDVEELWKVNPMGSLLLCSKTPTKPGVLGWNPEFIALEI